ncbi:YheC/D like ATP-grasp [uncultured archaeon]|nr:YheC/D like ATP-grasp [uncultured archaeon]
MGKKPDAGLKAGLSAFHKNVFEGIRDTHWRSLIYPGDHFPDYLFSHALSNLGVNAFSKKGTYIALGKYYRPSFQFINFSGPADNLRRLGTGALEAIANKLKIHGSIFIKPLSGECHSGLGVMRLSLSKNGVEISCSFKHDYEKMVKCLPSNFSFRAQGQNSVLINLQGIRLENVLAPLFHGHRGAFIVEREIHSPLFNGRKWEIRFIVHADDKGPSVVSMAAKVANNKIASNITSFGGKSVEPVEVVAKVYKSLYPGLSRIAVMRLTEEFVIKSREVAQGATKKVNGYAEKLRAKYLPTFPKGGMNITECGVDIMAELNSITGRLEPKIVEFQYPDFGFRLDSDVLGTRIRHNNLISFIKRGKEKLNKYFNEKSPPQGVEP